MHSIYALFPQYVYALVILVVKNYLPAVLQSYLMARAFTKLVLKQKTKRKKRQCKKLVYTRKKIRLHVTQINIKLTQIWRDQYVNEDSQHWPTSMLMLMWQWLFSCCVLCVAFVRRVAFVFYCWSFLLFVVCLHLASFGKILSSLLLNWIDWDGFASWLLV